MAEPFSVHDQSDFERVYDEDELVTIRKGDLRAVLDVATQSMDFGSGFLDNEQVEALRKLAGIIGIDPLVATPSNFTCQYKGEHEWLMTSWGKAPWACALCRHTSDVKPEGVTDADAAEQALEIVAELKESNQRLSRGRGLGISTASTTEDTDPD